MSDLRKNSELEKEIAREGITAGTSLFHPESFGLDPLPEKIYSGNYTKAEALKICEEALTAQQWEVYLAIKKIGPASDSEIAKYLGIERSSVNGRRNELQKYGLVEFFDKKKFQRGHNFVNNIRWKAVIRIPDHQKFKKAINN